MHQPQTQKQPDIPHFSVAAAAVAAAVAVVAAASVVSVQQMP